MDHLQAMTRDVLHPAGYDLVSRSRFALHVGLPLAARRIALSPRPLLSILLTFLIAQLSPLDAAPVKVGGFGLFGNAELRSSLRLLEIEEGELDAQKIDDAAFLLLTRLTQNGYLDAQVSATYRTADEEEHTASWSAPFEPKIPEGVVATELRFQIDEGTLYYYQDVTIDGLVSLPVEEAKSYIIPDTSLYSRKKDRSYSPNILSNHQKQLTAALVAIGRTDAKVTASSIELDKATGAVNVTFQVSEGPLYKITQAEAHYLREENLVETKEIPQGAIYTRTWVEDQTRAIRNEAYRLGYPDTKVSNRVIKATPEENTVSVHIRFEVRRGPKVTLTGVEHKGATNTHLPLLDRKTDLTPGEPLDITKAEAARRRLSRLGIFERIDLSYQADGTGQRKAIFDYKPGERIKAQLLLGYGSYEQFRAGLLARRENLFGRAHTLSFEAIRSIKSTSGRLDYTVPELLGESIDGTFEINFLDRQELYFDREERGVSVGLFRRFPQLLTDVGIDYALERKASSDPKFNEEFGLQEANIGSLSLRATRSNIDDILYPKSGYEISGVVRYADESLGGESSFLKPELGFAYHKRLGDRWLFHLGTKAAQITYPEGGRAKIPDNEFYLVGGENSVRGYRRGEAVPLAEEGKPTRVEAYALINLELEYPIFDRLNIVLFTDAARVWERTDTTDVYEDLASVGLGFRYNTIVGPVRLEYGHNIDPRPEDPRGTVHLSIGFPF
ncbi:BamA/TamA family outer membrane protein [Pelagicoccus sp. NFK12]|uniref:BamA/TamA family outer membrane protein n=1 Tax=Pelagicoccus enzymogenes TaxID=2773457 RepID=A0A927FBG8_9BACT|nr:BamA/TamA family outer membrane protein [Pelagicoccus enzymogenes]MBD5781286.1 BamA/TamA family outer membrane protein [Pelagicoccus enzymogenes]